MADPRPLGVRTGGPKPAAGARSHRRQARMIANSTGVLAYPPVSGVRWQAWYSVSVFRSVGSSGNRADHRKLWLAIDPRE